MGVVGAGIGCGVGRGDINQPTPHQVLGESKSPGQWARGSSVCAWEADRSATLERRALEGGLRLGIHGRCRRAGHRDRRVAAWRNGAKQSKGERPSRDTSVIDAAPCAARAWERRDAILRRVVAAALPCNADPPSETDWSDR